MSQVVSGDMSIDSNWRIGIVCSRFNEPVTEKLLSGAVEKCQQLKIAEEALQVVSVPGAVEIPVAAQWLLDSGCDGVIALGAVIRGETTHYDYVCNSVERGCSELALKYNKPVIFGVLTTENGQQAFDRIGGSKGHKGEESVEALIEMLNLKKRLT